MMKLFTLYIIVFIGFNLHAQNDYNVKLKTGAIQLHENRQAFKSLSLQSKEFNERSYYLVQFYEIPSINLLRELNELDIRLLEYIPEKTYIVSLPSDFGFSRLESFNIRSIQNIKPEYKIAESVKESAVISKDPSQIIDLVVHTYKDIPSSLIVERLSASGIIILSQHEDHPFFLCRLNLGSINKLADEPFVAFIEKPSPPGTKEDRGARNLHRSSTIDNQIAGGLKYDGTGVNVCVRDDGRIGPHIDYKGRLDQTYCYSNIDYATHGDMVSGVFMGAGNLDPDVTGIAKGAFLYTLEYEGGFMDETLMLHKEKNVTITNSSYSDGCNDGYTVNAFNVDKQLFDYPYLMHVFSSGNMGTSDCNYGAGNLWGNITGGHKIGKNSLTVGNVNELGALEKTSSRGPATDGRIKPDLCAQGNGQYSTYPDNKIDNAGGTSASCPGVSGVLAQLTQAYKELNNNTNPPSALLKASILNTATDIDSIGPDFKTGWGIVNAYRAYKVLKAKSYWSGKIEQNITDTKSLQVPTGTKKINVMLYWSDLPGSVLSAKALVNDLDLKITDITGKAYYPWVLNSIPNPDSLNKSATKGLDHLNNMEQVSIDLPLSGEYTVSISGSAIPFGDQDYWVVYEIIPDTPKIVFPIGGESFFPKELLNIQWDAAGNEGEFSLDYSLDTQNWTFIKKIKGDQRRVYWQTLAIPHEKVWLRLSRNGKSDIMQAPYTIIKRVDSLKVLRTCPDYTILNWEKIDSAAKYIVYQLGDKYMKPLSPITDTFINIPLLNPGIENWFSVQPVWNSGTLGKRSIAVKVQNLKECKQNLDLALYPLISNETTGVYCEGELIPVIIKISNEGLNPIPGFQLKLNISPGISKTLNSNLLISPGSTIQLPIDTIVASQTGEIYYNIIIKTPGETAFFNDTLNLIYRLQVQPSNGFPIPVVEEFEGQVFPPLYWQVIDTLFDVRWDRIECIGSDGKPTKAAWLNNYSNPATGSYDDLITPNYNISNASQAYLLFDLSYAIYDPASIQDSLAVEVSIDCGKTFPYRIYYSGGEAMQTAGEHSDIFIPGKASEWKLISLSLSAFNVYDLSFRFRNITGYGNSLLIDNVKVLNNLYTEANIVDFDSIGCVGIPVEFYAQISPNSIYIWTFGNGSNPSSASGQGPHSVTYTTLGLKEVKLEVNGNSQSDSAFVNVNIEPTPDADFTYAQDGSKFIFTSFSNYPTWTHFWDFGDQTYSTDSNPEHTFLTGGNYVVQHTINGYCGTQKITKTIILTDVAEPLTIISIYPNPADNKIIIRSVNKIDRIEISDLSGKVFLSRKQENYLNHIELDVSRLVPGMYFIKVFDKNNWHVTKLSVL